MKNYGATRRSQAALEYLLVIGIALFILTGFLIYSFYYSTAYSTTESSQGLSLVINSVQSAVNSLSSEQYGSTFDFGFSSPGLSVQNSYFCGNYIILSSQTFQAAQLLSLPVAGEMPVTSGQFDGQGVLSSQNGNPIIDLKFDLPISFINTSYSMSSPYLFYNVSFQSFSGALVRNVNFTIFVYTMSNSLLNSTNLSTASGFISGKVNISKSYPTVKVVISVPSFSVSSASCLAAAFSLPLTFLNTQLSATASPFQQEVIFNSSAYSKYEAPNLQNVQFAYQNGTIVPSWLGSGNIANFNGNSYTLLPKAYPNKLSSYTINIWADPSTSSFGSIIATGDGVCGLGTISGNPITISAWNNQYYPIQQIYWQGVTTNVSLAVGSWSMVTLTLSGGGNGTGNMKIYLNGKPQDSVEMQEINYTGSTTETIGGTYNCNNIIGSFMGNLANYQFYNNTISASQIQQIYSKGMGGAPIYGPNLVGWWPLDATVNDTSGNGNNGRSVNMSFLGAGSASSSTIYWLKIGSIPANSKTSIVMNFYPTSYSMLNTVNTGEAPQLSPAYAQYDDGQKVFLEYGDFINGVGFDGWTAHISGGKFTPTATNAGIEVVNDSAGEGTQLLPPTSLPEEPVIVEYGWNFSAGPSDGEILSLFGNTAKLIGAPVVTCGGGVAASNSSVMLMVEPAGMNCSTIYIPAILDSANKKIISTFNNLPYKTPQYYTVLLEITSSTQASGGVINKLNSLQSFSSLNIPIIMSGTIPNIFNYNYPTLMIGAGSGGGSSYQYIQWLMAMAYPPNGVMPSVSLGNIAQV